MPIPLVVFVAGASVGAAATYLYKDEKARNILKKNINIAKEKISEGINNIKSMLKKEKDTSKPSTEKKIMMDKPSTETPKEKN